MKVSISVQAVLIQHRLRNSGHLAGIGPKPAESTSFRDCNGRLWGPVNLLAYHFQSLGEGQAVQDNGFLPNWYTQKNHGVLDSLSSSVGDTFPLLVICGCSSQR